MRSHGWSDTQVAAARIKTGAVVEVDGAAGTVTVLESAPDADLKGVACRDM
jgi:hypothetical protein